MNEWRICQAKDTLVRNAFLKDKDVHPAEISIANDPKYARLSAQGFVLHLYDCPEIINHIDDVVKRFKAEGMKVIDAKAVDRRVYYVMTYDEN